MITAAQLRAARALIGWKQAQLAEASGVSEISIKNIERGATDPRASTVIKLRNALGRAGVTFIADGDNHPGGAGVRLLKPDEDRAKSDLAKAKNKRAKGSPK